jgi:hypothetical protein
MVDQARRLRRHESTDLLGPVRVGDVEHAHARVLVGGEDQLGADQAAGPVLVDVVRAEMAALGDIVGFGRGREGGDGAP